MPLEGGTAASVNWAVGYPSTGTIPTDITCGWAPSSYANGTPFRYAAYGFGLNGETTAITDADNNTTNMSYDGFVRLSSTSYPDLTKETLWYTTTGAVNGPTCGSAKRQPCGKINRAGQNIGSTYDALDRKATKSPPDQGTTTFGYNLVSEQMLVSRAALNSYAAHSTSYTYDAAGRKASETNDARSVSYLYDPSSNRSQTTWPDGYYVSYLYDSLNRMQYAYESGTTELANFNYDPLSRPTYVCLGTASSSCATGGGTNGSSYNYDANSYLSGLSQVLNATSISWSYGRNHTGQLTSMKVNDDSYLPAPAAGSAAYAVNNLNEYTTAISQPSTYDSNGNLHTWYQSGSLQTYTYDSENRLVQAVNSGTGITSTYDYDGLGRRYSKTVAGVVTLYLLEGDEEIAELNSTGTLLRRYISGPGTDSRIVHAEGINASEVKTYYHTNHQGSVVDMTDGNGNLQQQITYDEFGQSPAASTGEAFRYAGRRLDAETGLYYYRARYYAPQLGRFLQTDPVQYKDDIDLYTYVGNDPLDKLDPSGKTCTAAVDGGVTCHVDDPGKLTAREVAIVNKAYTKAVNALLAHADSSLKMTINGVSRTVNAGDVAKSLESRVVIGGDNKNDRASTVGGPLAPRSGGVAQTTIDRNSLTSDRDGGTKNIDADLSKTIIHEGMHSLQGEDIYRPMFNASPKDFGKDHQAEYNRVSDEFFNLKN